MPLQNILFGSPDHVPNLNFVGVTGGVVVFHSPGFDLVGLIPPDIQLVSVHEPWFLEAGMVTTAADAQQLAEWARDEADRWGVETVLVMVKGMDVGDLLRHVLVYGKTDGQYLLDIDEVWTVLSGDGALRVVPFDEHPEWRTMFKKHRSYRAYLGAALAVSLCWTW